VITRLCSHGLIEL